MQTTLNYFDFLAVGAEATVKVAVLSFGLTLVFAFVAGVCRAEKIPGLNFIAGIYVEIFRGTSLLVQLFWIYYSLPLIGVTLSPMIAGCFAIGLNAGAYGSEIVRGAIRSVPATQLEAAKSLSLSRMQTIRKIVLPQALPEMIPPFGNLAIMVLKDTSLISMISIADIAFRAQQLRSITYDSAKIYLISLIMYFSFSLMIMAITKICENYTKPRFRRAGFWSMGASHG
ncbi:MAG: ectoine/hydroxyectoine ABC transporter permease subunit EhuC [Pseudochelatococcus sp.]|jgi:polar amino acid transport system permease protein|uniref:ectoine/hydroxyectoine ABC transporter permease subunit EhuC n=1 Tax=Pseudochelatococcus sp. TaxID=2020869 RepID=UPI003D8BCDC5